MRAPFLFVVALLGVSAGVAFLLQDGSPVPMTVATELPAAAPETSAAAQQTPASAERSVVDRVVPSSMQCSVRGRVIDRDGGAIPGATIVLGATGRRSASGDDGGFVFADVTAEPSTTIEVAHPGKATLLRAMTLWPDAEVDIGDLVLHAQTCVRGTVLDEAGQPVPKATVHAGRLVAMTGDGGWFELSTLAAGRHLVCAEAPGYAGRPVAIELAEGETKEAIELRLDRARTLSGRVATRHGQIIAGASIEARLDQASAPMTLACDAEGRFEVGPLPAGKVQMVVTHPAFLPFGRVYPTDAGGVNITLTETPAILGRVVAAATGTEIPITSVHLLVSSETERGPWRRLDQPVVLAAEDAAAGRFRLPLGIHTLARVLVLSEGCAPVLSESFWMGNRDPAPLVLRARTGVRLTGVLCDERGLPVPGAKVAVLAPIGEGELVQTGEAVVLAVQRSDANGAFESTPLEPGRYRVSVRRPGYAHVDLDIELGAEPTTVQLAVARAGTIRGRVPHDRDLPVRLRVAVTRLDAAPVPAGTRPDRLPSALVQDGAFVLTALEPGSYSLQLLGLARGAEKGDLASVVEVAAGRESYVEFAGSAAR